METVHESIYDHPKYYDLVFGSDCAAEIRFIEGCGQLYTRGKLRRLFEPACGTGRLLLRLAKRGYAVSGIDLNPKAIEFCNERLERHGLPASTWVADMSQFQMRQRADIAFNTINSFRHLGSERAARGHLRCMAQALRPGGIYLLGIHLTPTAAPPSDTESWSARRGHLAVNTHMWTRLRDLKNRVERFGIRFDVHTPRRSFRIEDELVLRSYTQEQFEKLVKAAGTWEIIAAHDFGYACDAPIKVDATNEDVVYVLRRIG